jgi:hypothetical protein
MQVDPRGKKYALCSSKYTSNEPANTLKEYASTMNTGSIARPANTLKGSCNRIEIHEVLLLQQTY